MKKNRVWELCSAGAALLLLLTGCGGGGGSTPPPVVVQSIAITPASPMIEVGGTQQFVATATYSDGHSADVSSSASWVLEVPSTGTVSSGGLVTGVASGSTLITASVGSISGNTRLTIRTLQAIEVRPADGPLQVISAATQFIARATYSAGPTADLGTSVTWTSSVPAVATVSASGLVTPVSGGKTTITATRGSITGAAVITVNAASGWQFTLTSLASPFVPTPFPLTVQIKSPNEVQTVTASMGGVSTNLTSAPRGIENCTNGLLACWTGALDLSSLARGTYPLILTATDVLGHTETRTEEFFFNRPPTIQLTRPSGNTVSSQGSLTVVASCADDAPGGCVSLELCVVGKFASCEISLAKGAATLNTTVDLSAYAAVNLMLIGMDSDSRQTTVSFQVYVDKSTHYTSVAEVPGLILDADATRILYYDGVSSKTIIRDRNTQADTLVYSADPSLLFEKGYLTPAGAAVSFRLNGTNTYTARLFEAGSLVDLGTTSSSSAVSAKGSYVIWTRSPNLYRRDVSAHTTITITPDALDGNSTDVASNGAVAYTDLSSLVRLYKADGTDVPLVTDATKQYLYPRTDGTRVVYSTKSGANYSLVLNDGSSEVQLTTLPSLTEVPDYQIAGGWVAYAVPGPSGVNQIWRRNSSGQSVQLTFASDPSRIDALDESGLLTLTTNFQRRYLVDPSGTTSVEIGTAQGRTLFINGVPHVAIAGTLYVVH